MHILNKLITYPKAYQVYIIVVYCAGDQTGFPWNDSDSIGDFAVISEQALRFIYNRKSSFDQGLLNQVF